MEILNPKSESAYRKIRIIRLLAKKRMSLEELAEKLQVPDLDLIRSDLASLYMVGSNPFTPLDYIEIEGDERSFGIILPASFQDSLGLSAAEWWEIRSLLESRETEDLSREDSDIVQGMLKKIYSVVPTEAKQPFMDKQDDLQKAIQKGRQVHFDYVSWDGGSVAREVDPWFVFLLEAHYLCGYCHLRKDVRYFRVESIHNLKILDRPIRNFPEQDRNSIIDGLSEYARSEAKSGEAVRLFHTESVYFNLNRRLGLKRTSDTKIINGRTFYLSETEYRTPQKMIEILLGFGPDVLVQGPADFRNEFLEELALRSDISGGDIAAFSR